MPDPTRVILVAGPAHRQPAQLPAEVRELVLIHLDREQTLLYSDTGIRTRSGARLFEYCGLAQSVPE